MPGFDSEHRATLALLADVLIPAGADQDLPSASQAGVAAGLLDEVLTALPEVAEPLSALLEALRGSEPSEAIARLQTSDPAGFDLLCNVVAGAYFLNPDV